MKYIYINTVEDRISATGKFPIKGLGADVTEYIVNDNFDMCKDIDDGDGGTVSLDGFLTPTEFLARYNADYVSLRVAAYPPMEDYLDAIVKDDSAAIAKYKSDCLAVKAAHPKE